MTVGQARGVGPLLEEWAALTDRAGAPPSLHPGYVTAWVDAYSKPERLRAVTARRDGELAAVLPLVMTRWGLSTAAQPDVEEVGVVSEDPRAASAAMTAALKLPVARLLLRPVPAGSVTHVALAQAAAARGATFIERVVDEHPRVDVDSDWDTYWASFKSRVRNDVSRRRRRLEELGEWTSKCWTGLWTSTEPSTRSSRSRPADGRGGRAPRSPSSPPTRSSTARSRGGRRQRDGCACRSCASTGEQSPSTTASRRAA